MSALTSINPFTRPSHKKAAPLREPILVESLEQAIDRNIAAAPRLTAIQRDRASALLS